MVHTMKRKMSLILAGMLVISTVIMNVPSNVYADGTFAGGDGSVENPYQIADAIQLNEVRHNSPGPGQNYLKDHFILTANIDLSAYASGEGWVPIGDNTGGSTRFEGTFDGKGHTISGLVI